MYIKYHTIYIWTYITALNPVISPKLRMARLTSTLRLSYDLHEIRLSQTEALLEQKYFTGSMPLLTPTTLSRHDVVLRLSSIPHCFEMWCIISSGGQERYILKAH